MSPGWGGKWRPRTGRYCHMLLWLVLVAAAPATLGYVSDTRQQLTFLAARQFNHCVDGTSVPQLTALEVRNLVRGNLAESDAGWWHDVTHWGFYDRRNQETHELLLGQVETRMHARYESLARQVVAAPEQVRDLERFELLGSSVHFLQGVTVPANVVPVFHPRPWRLGGTDRFTVYPPDRETLAAELSQLCDVLLGTPASENLITLLDRTAAVTIANIRAPIADMEATWHSFWEEAEPGAFGDYGPAGNRFGLRTEFPCGDSQCALMDDDPIYREFALRQHRLAALSTMRAILILQRFRVDTTLTQKRD